MQNEQSSVTHIDLLRHGECEGGQIFRGSSDVALNPLGLKHMNKALAQLKLHAARPYDAVISSPLKRCHDFATTTAEADKCKLHTESDLREIFFGDWEGKEIESVYTSQRALVDAWYRRPLECSPPNGENTLDFYHRVSDSLASIITHFHKQHILLVVHAGVIRMIIAKVLNIPLDNIHSLKVPYACISRISVHTQDEQHFYQLDAHNIPF